MDRLERTNTCARFFVHKRTHRDTNRGTVGGPHDLTILIVEDDDRIRDLTADILESAGYDVARARNGIEALDALAAVGHIRLVLTDLRMPTMDGCALIEAMRSDHLLSKIAILILTGDVAPTRVPAGIRVLHKPFRLDALLDAVATELGSKQQTRRSDAPAALAITAP